MSGPWWGKDVDPAVATAVDDAALATSTGPLAPLTTVDPAVIGAELDGRRAGFTPTWTSQRIDDPGVALIAVYAEQHAAVAGALDDLPTKARVEHLIAAGVVRRAPRPLAATLVFEVSASAPGSVLVGEGFEVQGNDSAGNSVTFETDRSLYAAAGKLSVLGRRTSGNVGALTIPTLDNPSKVYPFGLDPQPGVALYLGIEAQVAPTPQLAIGIYLAAIDGAPPPATAGGLVPPPGLDLPRLGWELFDGRSFNAAEVIRDETQSFTQSGVVELDVPPGMRPGVQPGTDPTKPMYWVRCRLLAGEWPAPPAISAIAINVVPAHSGQTVRDEIVDTPVTVDPAQRRVLKLSRSPVLEGTLAVQIDEGGAALETWEPVADLSQVAPDERKFRFDPATGTLTFGDGRNGRPLPEGFRNVHATYRVAVTGGTVAAKGISTLVGAAPFLASVANPLPATGGTTVETLEAALLRGPREIRARDRAVAAADYEILALRAPGADIRRAHAVGGLHPRFPGAAIPGVVGVFVVGNARDDGQPPLPSDATLHAVSDYLATWAPRGAEVTAVAPVFHSVRVEATFDLDRKVDVTETVHAVSQFLDRWFDPVRGGETGEGWPFGGTIEYSALIRKLLRTMGGAVTAVPRLVFVVDGVRSRHCADVAIPAHDLLWPAAHELVALPRRAS